MEEASVAVTTENMSMDLPPGFRFHPTDEEIIIHYLSQKVLNNVFRARAIGEADLNKCEPWDLPKKAKMGEKEWYFFCQRDRKYPTGTRTNRATKAGYWKATGKDREIYKGKNCLVGMKKTLVFYKGRAPKGEKTNWVTHEFRLEGKFSYNLPRVTKDEWVVCRVFHKITAAIKRGPISGLPRINFFGEEILDSPSLPPLFDPPYFGEAHEVRRRPTTGQTRAQDGSSTCVLPYFAASTEDHEMQPEQKVSHDKQSLMNNHANQFKYPSPNSNPLSHNPHLISIHGSLGYLHQPRNNISIPNFQASNYSNPELAMLRALSDTDEAQGLKGQCKVEQFSNQSVVSQDTGLSTDVNTEISSVASKHDPMGSGRGYEDPECLWNY